MSSPLAAALKQDCAAAAPKQPHRPLSTVPAEVLDDAERWFVIAYSATHNLREALALVLSLSRSQAGNLRVARLQRPSAINVHLIVMAVAKATGQLASDIIGRGRTEDVAWARHLATWLARHLTGLSYPALGRLIGHRGHQPALESCRVVQREFDAGTVLGQHAGQMLDELGGERATVISRENNTCE